MPFGFGRGRGSDKTRGRSNFRTGKRMAKWGLGGPPTDCICPQCGHVAPREPGVPCFQKKCPQCGSFMARQFLKVE